MMPRPILPPSCQQYRLAKGATTILLRVIYGTWTWCTRGARWSALSTGKKPPSMVEPIQCQNSRHNRRRGGAGSEKSPRPKCFNARAVPRPVKSLSGSLTYVKQVQFTKGDENYKYAASYLSSTLSVAMATKNLSFKSVNLGEDVTLLLCFTPPSPDLFIKQFPVAWKVTTLSAVGHSGIDATWTSTLGFCMPQIGGGQRIVSASNYTHMKVGDVTTLTVNNAVNPPVYFFTPPIARPGVDSIQAINNVGHPATIALGFITDPDTPNEVMNPVLTWTDVGNGLAVTGEFTPVLRAYVALKYQASEILRGEVQGVKPIWEANLLSLGPHTTIIVSKDATGAFVGKKLGGNAKDAPLLKVPSGFPDGKSRVYKADLAFSTPKIALQAARAIGDQLFGKSYLTKFIYKEGAAEARIELSLPCGVSCHQAERDMVSALEGEPFIGHHAQIKGHGGQILLSTEGSFSYWSDINPATIAWYITGKGNAITRSADESEIDFEDGEPGDAVTVNGSPNLLGPGNYNGRTISRKASTASLAA